MFERAGVWTVWVLWRLSVLDYIYSLFSCIDPGFLTVIRYFCHLKPETKSESLQQQNLHPSSRGRKWGVGSGNGSLVRNRFRCCPASCEGREQSESGPRGPRRAALPSRVKNRPANLAVPSGSRWGVSRGSGRKGILPPALAARRLAEDDGSLSAQSSNTLGVIYTPVEVFEGTRETPAPQPVTPPAWTAAQPCGSAGLLPQQRWPSPGRGHEPRPCGSEPRDRSAHPLLGAALFGPIARSWARRSRRGREALAGPGRGLTGHAHGSRCGQGTGEGWIYPDRGRIRPSSLLEGVLWGRKDATGPRAAGLLLPVYGGDAGDRVVVADALGQ